MKTKVVTHLFQVGETLEVTEGYFKGCPATVTKQSLSTVTGYDCPAYSINVTGPDGEPRKTFVREDWLKSETVTPPRTGYFPHPNLREVEAAALEGQY